MEEEAVRAMIRSEPFFPFEIHTNSGVVYAICSRETIAMSPKGKLVVVFDPDEGVALINVDQIAETSRPINRRRKGVK